MSTRLLTPFSLCCLTLFFSLCLTANAAVAQGTAFTYQGKLTDSGNLANGTYDLQFKLFDTATVGTGTQQGSPVSVPNVSVNNGIFTVSLDFGACPTCFNGAARFLEIAVKPTSGSTFTTLGPRQPLTSTPYALKSQNAATADGLSVACVNCITSSQIQSVNGSAVSGTIPVASVPAGSANYIQNTTSQQASSNFNISGNGTAGGTLTGSIINAVTQFNLNGNRILTADGSSNLFAGISAGVSNTGNQNTFFGTGAGFANTTGQLNAFFGTQAGQNNTIGNDNSFFGRTSGFSNTTGALNAFFGTSAGFSNTTGSQNAFFGLSAGQNNTIGNQNAFFGTGAGQSNTSATANTFIGFDAGFANTTGFENAFFGYLAGSFNTTGVDNSFFGTVAGKRNTTGNNNAIFGALAGQNNTIGNQNAFFGTQAGLKNTTGAANTFIGDAADFNTANPTGDNNTLIGFGGIVNSGVSNSTAIGAFASVTQSNSLVLGSINGVNNATADTNVGIGTTAPVSPLHLNANSASFAVTFTNSANSAGRRGYRLAFDNDRFTFQRADDAGNFAENQVAIEQATGNVGIGTNAPLGKLQIVTVNDIAPTTITSWDNRHFVVGNASSSGAIGLSYDQTNNIGYIEALSPNVLWRDLVLQTGGGNVGIGITTAPGDRLHVAGDIRVGTSGTNGCLKNNNGGTIIGTCSSDARFKRDITPFPNLLSRLVQLRPIYFYWRSEQFPDRHFGQAQEAGLIAQEVEKVLPELVIEDEQGYKAVNYSKLPLLSIQAIKELKSENDTLKQKLSEQQQQLTQQQQEMVAIKQLLCAAQPQADFCKAKSLK